jgi:hypothetical protein
MTTNSGVAENWAQYERCGERHLGIDHYLLAARQPDHDIRPEATVIRRRDELLVEVAVGQHAGHLDDAAELDLAPPPAHGGGAQRLDQVAGLRLQLQLRLGQRFHLLAERRVVTDALLLDLVELGADLRQRVANRLDEVGDRLLPVLELAGRALLKLP